MLKKSQIKEYSGWLATIEQLKQMHPYLEFHLFKVPHILLINEEYNGSWNLEGSALYAQHLKPSRWSSNALPIRQGQSSVISTCTPN